MARSSLPSMSPPSHHSPESKKSWRAPLVILLALLAGTGCALAHHLMGSHLNGTPVADAPISQAWISRISTALAFSVKVALAVSVGTVYVQHQWLRIHSQSLKTKDVDALTSVLGNPLSFTSSIIWLRHPLLILIALISWSVIVVSILRFPKTEPFLLRAIPLATITAPGSLTVVPKSFFNKTQDSNVPQLQFNNFSNYFSGGGRDVKVKPRVSKLAYLTAITAQPIAIASSQPNETYHRDFYAPAIRFAPSANGTWVQNITIELARQVQGGSGASYLSWAGGQHSFPLEDYDYTPLDEASPDASRIFFVTTAGNSSTEYNFTDAYGDWSPKRPTVMQLSVIECILHNASYSVDSTFQFPSQNHEMTISRWNNPIAAYDLASAFLEDLYDRTVSYLAVMRAFGKLFVGTGFWDHYGSDDTYSSIFDLIHINWENRKSLPQQLEQLFQNITLSLLSDNNLM